MDVVDWGVLAQNGLIAAHAREVVHIARFGQANNGVDQQVGLRFFCGAERQFLMRTVQWIAGLEGHNFAPAHFAEVGAQFVWRVTAPAEIIVYRLLDARHRAAQIDLAGLVVQIVHGGVRVIVGPENFFGFMGLVRLPTVSDCHGAKDHALLVAQCDVLAQLDGGREVFGHIQRDRHRPKFTCAQAHCVDDAVVICLAQEPFEGVEPAVHQQFQIANLTWCQVMAGQITSFNFQLLR